ncbi:MAG: 4Fe-4S dicluster domain-containing protein [Chloroflexi bacterium]|nr:4Fe-4S dicluster domain-containing protein [Chloroflexota bacterium]
MMLQLVMREEMSGAQSFLDYVETITPGYSRLDMCIQCGTCGGSCPSGGDMDHTPRHLFALIRADMKDEVLASNTPWYCISCYLCMSRCPQEVHITDLMYTLKSIAIEEGHVSENTAANLSETFLSYVESYGRSFELGLATRFYLRHHPKESMGMAGMGFGMLTRGRMVITPEKIKRIGQLRSILNRAKELEAAL